MSETFPNEVQNQDVAWLYNKIRRFFVEVAKSQSATVSAMRTPDQVRLQSYLDSFKKGLNWVNAQGDLDLPESHPFPMELEAFPESVELENESANMVLRLFRVLAIELTNCQSAKLGSGLISHDIKRVAAIVTKIESFLNDYIKDEGATPLDYPESSPEEPMITDGAMG